MAEHLERDLLDSGLDHDVFIAYEEARECAYPAWVYQKEVLALVLCCCGRLP